MPALLTRMVIGPSAASAPATARATEARSVTSMASAAASPPLARISAASCSSTSTRRAASATLAPAAASTRAKWRPKPEEAPVTSAVLPASENRSLAVIVSPRLPQAFIPGTWPMKSRLPSSTPLWRRMA